ncbi:S-layer homology domain-containing protein [Thermohalobacter berrensis]|uniref:SLH domain-containing protein n=1 Tax=Thermohalobacter berrensis TaxID=99594 RepID=A0A419T7H1_9FIRM|nr:S-layer homology domain-containing protein [Thermohalobacter berrensis]RKD33504.1 hypothetical protein BET03_08950 [Thermohalobacter berrensis]
MRKVLSVLLVLSLVFGSFSFAFAASDIEGHKYEDAVKRLNALGLVQGDDRGFAPDDTITRAEFATLVVRALGYEEVAEVSKGATNFTDVPATHWASGYINIASSMGLINGYGDGQFGPEDQITYEQAITLMVRALGYKQDALDKGGYPVGYMLVAKDLDITDGIDDGVVGVPATRGIVFKLMDNSLTVDMMVKEGTGEDATWKVEEGKTILGELGNEKVTARVVDFNADDNEITLEGEKDAFIVPEGFDYEANFGLELTVWANGDNEVQLYEVEDEPLFDAVEIDGEDVELVAAEETYEVADDALIYVNGEEKDAPEAVDYAKVVLNDDDEVVFFDGYNWDDTMVVEDVDDDVVYSYNDDELDLEDYTLVKDGKTVAGDELEEGDILFFNEDAEYVVVYNESEEGELERVYTNSFKFEGEVYDNSNTNYDVKYLDGDELGKVDEEVLDAMKDEGEVEIFFDFAGNAVLVVGDQGEADTSSFYGVVNYFNDYTDDKYDEDYYVLEVLNEEGDLVEYDLLADDFTNLDSYTTGDTSNLIEKVVKVTVDEDGDVTEVDVLADDGTISGDGIEIDAVYADGFRLKDDTIVFWSEGETNVEDYAVMTWEEAADEFSKVLAADVYAENGRAKVLFVSDSDADTEDTDYTGLVTNVRELKSGDVWEVTIEINGEELEYLTDEDEVTSVGDIEDTIVTITVGNKSGEIKNIDESPRSASIEIAELSTADDTITATVTDDVYELVDNTVIYDKTDEFAELSLRDLEEGDIVSVYFVNDDTDRFVNYVVRTDLAPETPEDGDTVDGKTLEAIYEATNTLKIDGELYEYAGDVSELSGLVDSEITFKTQEVNGKVYAYDIEEVTE